MEVYGAEMLHGAAREQRIRPTQRKGALPILGGGKVCKAKLVSCQREG